MASPHSKNPTGGSGNRADYQAAFLQRVHRLLQLAYESLTPADYETSEEDDITGDLCRHMNFLTEVAPAERWMARFAVKDQDPSNDVPCAVTGRIRKGKRRPKIDIRIVCKHLTPNRGYCIEAKRLYRSDSVSEYTNDEGVGAFVCGDYATNDDFGGMLGYVQVDAIEKWLPKIESKLQRRPDLQLNRDGKVWGSMNFRRGPKVCFASRHRRDSGREICLIHVMLAFRGASKRTGE